MFPFKLILRVQQRELANVNCTICNVAVNIYVMQATCMYIKLEANVNLLKMERKILILELEGV